MFYAMKLVSLAADGDLLKTSVSAQQSTLSAYAVASNNGTTYVVLNNKDSANAVETTIRFMQPVTSAEATILTAPSLTSGVGTTLGGAVIDKDGAWSSPQTEHVSISGGNAVITVAPGSAVFINAAPATTSIGIPQSGLCVASTQDSASGPYIQQEQCESGSSSQAFAFVPTIDGHYYIRPQNSNLCLDWQNPNSAVLQTTCSHSNTQEWSLVSSANSTYTLKTGNGEYCMNVRYGYTSPGTPMNTWRCNNLELYTLSDPPKRPLTTTSSTITVSNDRYCMDVMGMTFAVGAYIQQHNCTGGSNESFALSSTTDGYYSISSNLNNLCLNAESTNSYIIQQTCNGSSAQKWQLKSNLDGSYSFQEENTRDCLGIANGSTSWGTLFSTLSCDESAGQKLWLSKAPTMD
jgi:hypothetical protein